MDGLRIGPNAIIIRTTSILLHMSSIRCWKTLILWSVCTFASAQGMVQFHFHLTGFPAKSALIGCYKAGETYLVDSVAVDESGHFSLRKNGLEPGVFFVAADKSRLFNFMLPKAVDTITISGNASDCAGLSSSNSPENEAFFRFEQQRQGIEAKIVARQSMYDLVSEATKQDAKALEPIKKEIDGYFRQIDSLARVFIVQYPTHLYAKMLKSVRPPEPPKSLVPALKGKSNPVYRRWVLRHYWDHTDFKDESLLNNQFWSAFFDKYFDRYIPAIPDSIVVAVDEVIKQMPPNGAFYQFAVRRFVQSFEMSDAPGADVIFVHMVDKYLKIKETPWLDIATLTRLEYKADLFRPVLTGKKAPPLGLSDEEGRAFDLDTVSAKLTLLIFYSPLCHHCMEVMPDIYQTWLDARVFGVKGVAVSVDEQYRNWQQFTRQQHWEWHNLADPSEKNEFEKQYLTNNLPVIYLLDKDKHILRKRIKPEELRDVLKIYLNNLK